MTCWRVGLHSPWHHGDPPDPRTHDEVIGVDVVEENIEDVAAVAVGGAVMAVRQTWAVGEDGGCRASCEGGGDRGSSCTSQLKSWRWLDGSMEYVESRK